MSADDINWWIDDGGGAADARNPRLTNARVSLCKGRTVVFLERCANAAGDVREPGQTAVITGTLGARFVDVEWGLAEGYSFRPDRGQLHAVDASVLQLVGPTP